MSMPSLSYAEKRRAPRVLRLRKARCVFNDGSSSLDVTLRNISFTGANIVSFTGENIASDALSCLPPTFEFQIHSTPPAAIWATMPTSYGREARRRASSSPTDGDEADRLSPRRRLTLWENDLWARLRAAIIESQPIIRTRREHDATFGIHHRREVLVQ